MYLAEIFLGLNKYDQNQSAVPTICDRPLLFIEAPVSQGIVCILKEGLSKAYCVVPGKSNPERKWLALE